MDGFSKFQCDKDKDMQTFLCKHSVLFEKLAKSRTYIFTDADALESGSFPVLAYFTLSLRVLRLDNIGVSKLNKLDGFSGKIKGAKVSSLATYLIGHLAKNDLFSDIISGSEVLQQAIQIIEDASMYIGGRIITVDCRPIKKLHGFYEKNGFLQIGHDDVNRLDQFIYFLNTKYYAGEQLHDFVAMK